MAEALRSLQQVALCVQLDERTWETGVERVAGDLEQWIQHSRSRPPRLENTRGNEQTSGLSEHETRTASKRSSHVWQRKTLELCGKRFGGPSPNGSFEGMRSANMACAESRAGARFKESREKERDAA